jgi:radical SAM superfamily enzyme YgiQ (UPF0313 family)
MLPAEAAARADAVVVGEAEAVWPRLLADLERGALEPIYRGAAGELDARLLPRRELLPGDYSFGSIQTSRGCPLDCEFCSVKAFNGPRFRQRPIEHVLDELAVIPQPLVFFTDDNLAGYSRASRERAKALFRGMLARGLRKRWFCQTSLNFADDEELVRLAAASGCMLLLVGIESIDPNVLRGTMRKGVNARRGPRYYREFIRKLHRQRIAVIGNMIFGNDEATRSEFRDASWFYLASGLDIPWPGLLTPYPGTRLHERLARERRILYTDYPADWSKFNVTNVVRPRHYTPDELVGRFKGFARLTFALPQVLLRAARTLAYSRSLERALLVYNMNRSLARRFDEGMRYPSEV